MGTWDDGLFDNDGALDNISEMLQAADIEVAEDAPRGRDPALVAILGRYRRELDAVLANMDPTVLSGICVGKLDKLARTESTDLYEAADDLGAGLGLLLLLTRPPIRADQVVAWRATFDRIDAATSEERGFWDTYATRVRAALERLPVKLRLR